MRNNSIAYVTLKTPTRHAGFYNIVFATDISVASHCPVVSKPFARSGRHQATIKQMYSKYTCTTCAL